MLSETASILTSIPLPPFLQVEASSSGLNIGLVAVLLVVSVLGYAVVNTIEIAIVGASRFRIQHLAAEGNRNALALQRVRARTERFFAAIVLLQNLTVVVASSMAGLIAVELAGGWGLIVATIVVTAVIAVLGELIPKVLAAQAADSLSLFVARPVELLTIVMRPIGIVLGIIPNLLARLLFGKDAKRAPTITEAELRMLIDISAEEGAVGEEEAELMDRVFRFYDRQANEVMVPRTEVVWVEAGTKLQDFYKTYDETPHSRFPVFRETLDEVVGVVNIKDVLRGVAQGKMTQESAIDAVMRPPYFVPETKMVGRLFVEMQERRQQMAVIVDEYGGTAGVVTIELLLEEMVGHVVDELGQPVQEFEAIDERTTRVDGGMSVDEARDELDLPIPDGDYETVAGYVLQELGHIPEEGETIVGDSYRITVAEVKGRKIEEVVVTRMPAAAPSEDEPAKTAS